MDPVRTYPTRLHGQDVVVKVYQGPVCPPDLPNRVYVKFDCRPSRLAIDIDPTWNESPRAPTQGGSEKGGKRSCYTAGLFA